MNKLILIALAATALTACQEQGLTIKGTIKGGEGKTIYLEKMDISTNIMLDSATIAPDGTFILEAPRDTTPTFYRATIDHTKPITLFSDTLDEISLEADLNAANWYSSITFPKEYQELNELNMLVTRVDDIQKQYVALIGRASTMRTEDRQAATDNIIKELNKHKSLVKEYVFVHPRSFVSYYALFQTIADVPVYNVMDDADLILFNTVATGLQLEYPNNERVKQLCSHVLTARAIKKKQKHTRELVAKAEQVNSPDIALPDAQGEIRTLSELRGKVVLLQFWASTDQNSRTMNRQLAKLYKQYHSKGLEIYQVSIDTSRLLWEDASRADNITWVNVCDLQGTQCPALTLYNVNSIPSNYILDRDGRLVGKDLVATRLDNRMAELLK